MMRKLMLAVGMATVFCGGAIAQERTLGRPGMSNVFVWQDAAAHSEALQLIRSGVYDTNPGLVTRLLACIAKPGDHAVVLESEMAQSKIVITDGAQSGCRGVIANEDLGR